jgi:hypothetical protein
MRDLKTQLSLTIHGSKKSVEQIADECGRSASYIYRVCLEGESGLKFPLELLVPLMHATGDYRILDRLNCLCDRVTVSRPRVGKLKRKEQSTADEIQANFHAAFNLFFRFWQDPDPAKRAELIQSLHRHECDIEAMKRSVKDFDQGDLF